MGSFGYGMQDNDTALDAIDEFIGMYMQDSFDEDYNIIGPLLSQDEMDALFLREDWGKFHSRCVLGMAEFIMGIGYSIEKIDSYIRIAYDAEIESADYFVEPNLRLQALKDFIQRVDEDKVSMNASKNN